MNGTEGLDVPPEMAEIMAAWVEQEGDISAWRRSTPFYGMDLDAKSFREVADRVRARAAAYKAEQP